MSNLTTIVNDFRTYRERAGIPATISDEEVYKGYLANEMRAQEEARARAEQARQQTLRMEQQSRASGYFIHKYVTPPSDSEGAELPEKTPLLS